MQNVEFLTIPSDTSRELQVEGGQLDVDNYLPYNLISQVNAQVRPPRRKSALLPRCTT